MTNLLCRRDTEWQAGAHSRAQPFRRGGVEGARLPLEAAKSASSVIFPCSGMTDYKEWRESAQRSILLRFVNDSDPSDWGNDIILKEQRQEKI